MVPERLSSTISPSVPRPATVQLVAGKKVWPGRGGGGEVREELGEMDERGALVFRRSLAVEGEAERAPSAHCDQRPQRRPSDDPGNLGRRPLPR